MYVHSCEHWPLLSMSKFEGESFSLLRALSFWWPALPALGLSQIIRLSLVCVSWCEYNNSLSMNECGVQMRPHLVCQKLLAGSGPTAPRSVSVTVSNCQYCQISARRCPPVKSRDPPSHRPLPPTPRLCLFFISTNSRRTEQLQLCTTVFACGIIRGVWPSHTAHNHALVSPGPSRASFSSCASSLRRARSAFAAAQQTPPMKPLRWPCQPTPGPTPPGVACAKR